jgi:hypothetical protein
MRYMVRRRPSRSATSGSRGGSASESATGPRSQPGCSAAPKCSASQRSASADESSSRRSRRAAPRRCPGADQRLALGRGARASLARSAPSRPGHTTSRTSRSRSENSRSVRPSPATTASLSPVRTPIAMPYSKEARRQRAGCETAGEARCIGEAHRRTPPGGMRRQQWVTRRVADDRRERSGRLGLGGDVLVTDRARGQLGPIPGHHVRRDQPRESHQRPPPHLGRRPGTHERPAEPVRGAS